MKISEATLASFDVQYPIERLGEPEELLFLDIETTGFTARSSYLYLIGCIYYAGGMWCTKQWFAENYEEERELLVSFFEFIQPYHTLIHFNGNHFDLPFLTQKCEQLSLPYNFEGFEGIDLYKRLSPLRFFLGLPNCKQKTLENYLGLDRKDVFTGGELIAIYHDYVKEPTDFAFHSIMLHNEDDLKGMLQILPMLTYYDLFQDGAKAKKVQANLYKDFQGKERQELLITVSLPVPIPKDITGSAKGCYFKASGNEGTIKVPIYAEELKYFYAGYQDYYYLPEEDLALHKSVATFVEKEHRIKATAATCYTRKQSRYLPQWDYVFEPFFRRDYKGKDLFFELTEELKRDRSSFTKYANHILEQIKNEY